MDCGKVISYGAYRCIPCTNNKRSEWAKNYWKHPNTRYAMLTGMNTLEEKRRRSEQGKRLMGNPERAQHHAQLISEAWANGIYDGVFTNPSGLERQVMKWLSNLPVYIIQQHRPYNYNRVYDFCIPELSLLIEVDGYYWHHSEKAIKDGTQEVDAEKDAWAVLNGYNLLRIDEVDVCDKYEIILCELLTTVM